MGGHAKAPWKNHGEIHLENKCSGKNLKYDGNHVTADGGNGKPATWKVHRLNPGDKPQHVKLENVAHPGRYLRIDKRGDLNTGKGGKWCEFKVEKHHDNFVLVSHQNKDHHVGFKKDGSVKPPKNVSNGDHAQFIVHK
mmetsp:Transcript_31817/g.49783  ORF Transcript_31817/g.49783 Transcript_31817/m.49783 type:complete len:138 (+) Transcript_31817:64-477(+)